ncbi:WXG100 family type VII secretion target [Streptomyces sp. SID14478]|uniref:WXG100 family type VII secretion target n=1 Tax=Streptomyces sp. SID14478 TaxID=2706073 RepID=UPI0013D9AD6E|nr:WXG100 family type VII secretion target [Streptomyces sp. SID14478]NEB73719.1 WXG100 family type VII secretion target [Streptomyces sp. SID14478]
MGSGSADDDHIAVSFGTLEHLTTELDDILRQLNGKLDDLYKRLAPVVASWQGEARDVFLDELDKWDTSARDLEAAQKWLHEVVTSGHRGYAAAHSAVLRGWGGA